MALSVGIQNRARVGGRVQCWGARLHDNTGGPAPTETPTLSSFHPDLALHLFANGVTGSRCHLCIDFLSRVHRASRHGVGFESSSASHLVQTGVVEATSATFIGYRSLETSPDYYIVSLNFESAEWRK